MSEDWEESIKLNLRELPKVLMFAETHKFFQTWQMLMNYWSSFRSRQTPIAALLRCAHLKIHVSWFKLFSCLEHGVEFNVLISMWFLTFLGLSCRCKGSGQCQQKAFVRATQDLGFNRVSLDGYVVPLTEPKIEFKKHMLVVDLGFVFDSQQL